MRFWVFFLTVIAIRAYGENSESAVEACGPASRNILSHKNISVLLPEIIIVNLSNCLITH